MAELALIMTSVQVEDVQECRDGLGGAYHGLTLAKGYLKTKKQQARNNLAEEISLLLTTSPACNNTPGLARDRKVQDQESKACKSRRARRKRPLNSRAGALR